ncbi:hypothetical protein SMC26_24130 [Actinomadura fulvescens]|uniref:Uncharacterized protein n=1 Tax=Actinomadura fulvescens TaxID=46160 RepID=A0ABN3Q2S7_9ACTN
MVSWTYDEDRVYHGFRSEDGGSLIDVELAEFGPTERTGVYVLRTLEESAEVGGNRFGWGYNGGGTSAAAHEILADALGQKPSERLREDFCEDVLSQMSTEFRLRRGAVLRWVRGWAAEHEAQGLPPAVEQLPPIDRSAYGKRPPAIQQEQKRRVFGKGAS